MTQRPHFFNSNKFPFLSLLLLSGLILAGSFSGCGPQKNNNDYNVLFISIDTLRADHLGCYGYQRNTSPNIDAFAKKNIRFKNFFTVVPKTGPSMTSFFTGQYIQNHGVVMNMNIRSSQTKTLLDFLPEDYKKVAYISNASINKHRGFDRGFDEFRLLTPKKEIEGWNQKELTPTALQWLKDNGGKEKFFMWLHYLDPHGPYTPPDEYTEMFINDDLYDGTETVPLEYDAKPGWRGNIVLGAVPKYQRLGDHNIVDYYIAQYDAEIRYTDAEVKKVLDYLDASGLMENTIVVITADHGESLGENNYYFEHGMFTDEGDIHIPFIMSHPDINEPAVIDALLQSTDFAPTVLSELGRSFPNKIDGLNFSALYHSPQTASQLRNFIYTCTSHEFEHFYEALRTKTDKLIRKDEQTYLYYDLTADPREEKNLFPQTNPAVLAQRMKAFEKFGQEPVLKTETEEKRNLPPKTLQGLKTLGYTQ